MAALLRLATLLLNDEYHIMSMLTQSPRTDPIGSAHIPEVTEW